MTASTRLPIVLPCRAVSRPGSSWPLNRAGLLVVNVLSASLLVLPFQMYTA